MVHVQNLQTSKYKTRDRFLNFMSQTSNTLCILRLVQVIYTPYCAYWKVMHGTWFWFEVTTTAGASDFY